jgi:hypothetical protein
MRLLTDLINEVTDQTNEFSFFIDDLTVEVTDNLSDLANEVTEFTNKVTGSHSELSIHIMFTLLQNSSH